MSETPAVYIAVTEKEFLTNLRSAAGRLSWLFYHTHDSRRSAAGFPDLVLIRPPRLIFAELKTESGALRPDQSLWIQDLTKIPGVEVYVWRPSQWDAILEILS